MKPAERYYSTLVVSSGEPFFSSLLKMMPPSRFDPVRKAGSISAARRMLAERAYDIVIVNSPLKDDAGMGFAIDASGLKGTIVLLIIRADQHDEVHAKVSPHGVFTISKPLHRSMMVTALMWIMSARERVRNLEIKTHSIEEKMSEIRTVNRAKWLLIRELKMEEPEAHRYIEKQAMDRCVTRREIAENIIKTYS